MADQSLAATLPACQPAPRSDRDADRARQERPHWGALVWWLRLGIAIERIKPGNPQQNAREELLKRWEKDDGHNAIEASISIVEKASEGEDINHEALAWLIHIVIFVKRYSEAVDQLSFQALLA